MSAPVGHPPSADHPVLDPRLAAPFPQAALPVLRNAQLRKNAGAMFRCGDDQRRLPGDQAFAQEFGDDSTQRFTVFVELDRMEMTRFIRRFLDHFEQHTSTIGRIH